MTNQKQYKYKRILHRLDNNQFQYAEFTNEELELMKAHFIRMIHILETVTPKE